MIENFPKNGNFYDRRKVFVEFRKILDTQLFTVSITSYLLIGQDKKNLLMKKEGSNENKKDSISIYKKCTI